MMNRKRLIVLLLTALLPACAMNSKPPPVPTSVNVTKQIQLPPLPESARQKHSPDYSLKLKNWQERALEQLTTPSKLD